MADSYTRFFLPRPDRPALLWRDDAARDVRHALRQLRREPGLTALLIVTLAIGIGGNVTMAGAIDRLIFRPPPQVADPENIVRLLYVGPRPGGGTFASAAMDYPTLLDMAREVSAFSGTTGYASLPLSFGSGPDAIRIRATLVAPSFFPLMGIRPALGRTFSPADGYPTGETTGGPPLAVLSHDFWQRQYAGDSGVVGRSARIGSQTYTIVGVAPPRFQGLEAEMPDVWLPVSVAGIEFPMFWMAGRNATWLSIVARLRPGATATLAGDAATAVIRSHMPPRTAEEAATRIVAAPAIRGRGPDAPREVKVALWLGGVSALVLLIACANVANLLLGRVISRRREIAVRIALGARRGRLARQLMTEAMLLAGLGGVAALAVTGVGGHLLQGLFVTDLAGGGFVSLRLFGFAAVSALGTGLLISLSPVLQTRAPDLTLALRAGATTGSRRGSVARTVLLATQGALCIVLLVGAGLFAVSLRRVRALDLGLDLDRTLEVRFDFNRDVLPVRADYETASAEMLARVAAVPGVERAARRVSLGAFAPRSDATRGVDWWTLASRAGFLTAVDSGYFQTLGATRSLRGRDFDDRDRAGAERVTVVTAPLARLLWPDEDALGRCMTYTMWGDQRGGCVRVVGVVSGFMGRDILDRGPLEAFIPLDQRASAGSRPGFMYVLVGTNPSAAAPAVRRAVQSVHSGLPAITVRPARDAVEPQMRPWRLAAGMFSLFGAIALVIAIVGLYGVVSYSAAQRSTEVSVRVALGARPAHVLAVVAGDALITVTAGLVMGLAAALTARRWVGPLLFQTSPRDPGVMVSMAGLLLLVSLTASLVPTARALCRNPADLLRTE